MKNGKMITSWNKIEPSDSANERMLSAITERNRSVHNAKDKANTVSRKISARRVVVAVSACLVILTAVTAIYGGYTGRFGSGAYTVGLANGDSIVYRAGAASEASFNSDVIFNAGFPVSSRELTDEESDVIFPSTSEPRRATGTFRDETGELLRIEGEIGNAKVIYASDGFPVNDVEIRGKETPSSVDGIPVTTGYSVREADSKGNRTVVFFGTFTLGGTNIYVERSGDKSEADDVGRDLSALILGVIEHGEPDFNLIAK